MMREFLQIVLTSPFWRRRISEASGATAQPHLYLGDLRSLPVPLPPFTEQFRIVGELERRSSVLDELEITIEHGLMRAERLRQAILKRAFEGRLVPQDPDDEPASALLERIRAERSLAPGRATNRTGRPARRARAAADEATAPRLF
jgi:type I restriction enzyme, S subunit